jgi:hypothetical protein
MSLALMEPSKPRTTLEITRGGPDGRIVGCKEVITYKPELFIVYTTQSLIV